MGIVEIGLIVLVFRTQDRILIHDVFPLCELIRVDCSYPHHFEKKYFTADSEFAMPFGGMDSHLFTEIDKQLVKVFNLL